MSENLLVSILINNYNYGRYIRDAINSCLNQDYSNVEIIVVDDGSTDNSREIIDSYEQDIIKVYQKNGGQASAMNAGVLASHGDIICFLDADDLCLPNKASEVANHFTSYPEIDWVFHESPSIPVDYSINANSDIVTQHLSLRQNDHQTKLIDFRQEIRKAKLPSFTPSTSNLCFSRALAEKIFPLPEIRGKSGLAVCDNYLKMISVGLGKGIRTKQDLGVFRVHYQNLYSLQKKDSKREICAEIFLATACCLARYSQEFDLLSDKMFAKGLGTYWRTKKDNDCCEELISEYFSGISGINKLSVLLKSFYYFLKLQYIEII